jgi:hypothetical protein
MVFSRFFENLINLLLLRDAGNTPKSVMAFAASNGSLPFEVVIGNKKANEIPLMVKPTVAPVRRRANSFVMACSVSADANFRGAITVLAESKLMLAFCAFAVRVNSSTITMANFMAKLHQVVGRAKYVYQEGQNN